jgi:hypothetical protein
MPLAGSALWNGMSVQDWLSRWNPESRIVIPKMFVPILLAEPMASLSKRLAAIGLPGSVSAVNLST